MKNLFAIISLGLLLSGCGHLCVNRTQQIVIVAPAPHVHAPKIEPVKTAPVQWKVYNTNDLAALVQNSNKTGNQVILFALDEANFKLLNDNLSDIKRYIKQQNAAISFLDKAANAPADAADAAAAAKDGKK